MTLPHCTDMSQIQQFYVQRNVFITGGTGFLGKVLTEKLIRSCPDIGIIYVLIREKKGKDTKARMEELMVDTVFETLRRQCPDFSRKIVGIPGDITKERLGLSDSDYSRIVNEVSMIFHLAATVRFTEKLETAVAVNVNSVKFIIDVAKACKNLKAGIYVSTAYSHCVRKTIDEKLYPSPMSYEDINLIIEDAKENNYTQSVMTILTKSVLGEWPNTYTFTKAIAEGVVAEFAKDIPFAIFRPSIVTPSYTEPSPGWLASPMGHAGLFVVTGLGIMHVLLIDGEAKADTVPVDYACNALITCAWETATTERSYHENIPVYNYVSGNENPITWKHYTDLANTFGHLYPTNSAVYYHTCFLTKSTWLFNILEFFLHIIPALLVDLVARLLGKQPRFYKIVRNIGEAIRAVAYFAARGWDFDNQRVQNLWKRIEPEDRREFPFNVREIDWDDNSMKMIRGLRKYVLNDPQGNEPQARRRQLYLYIIHTIVRLIFGFFVLWIIWKVFSNTMSHGSGLVLGFS